MSLRPKAAATHAADGRSLATVLAAGQPKPTGRGETTVLGGLGSLPEDHWRRQKPDGHLVSDVQYATQKRDLLRQLLSYAEAMPVKSNYVQREIASNLPWAIEEEAEEIRKLNVEINRRRAEGSWSLN